MLRIDRRRNRRHGRADGRQLRQRTTGSACPFLHAFARTALPNRATTRRKKTELVILLQAHESSAMPSINGDYRSTASQLPGQDFFEQDNPGAPEPADLIRTLGSGSAVSLLMDALKKAELAKRQGQGETAGDAGGQDATAGLMLEPMADSSPPASGSAENLSPEALASRLEEIDTQFLAEAREAAAARLKAQATAPSPAAIESSTEQAATNRPARTPGAQEARRPQTESAAPQDRSAAQNVFAAKQADKPSGRKNAFAITVGAGDGSCGLWHRRIFLVAVAAQGPTRRQPAAADRHAGTRRHAASRRTAGADYCGGARGSNRGTGDRCVGGARSGNSRCRRQGRR
jgi:hypothetical protein